MLDNNSKIKNSIVVGSKGHNLATKCIDWGEPFYVADYGLIILNLSSLSEDILSNNSDHFLEYFNNIKEKIVEAQEKLNIIIICIMDSFVKIERGNKILTNYNWCPIIPILEENPGNQLLKKEAQSKLRYLNLIKKWDLLLKDTFNNTGFKNGNDSSYNFQIIEKSYLKNILEKDVAFSLNWLIHSYGVTKRKSIEPIIFLPRIDDLNNGINLLLEDFLCVNEPEPLWLSDVKIFGEEQILKELKSKNEEIKNIEDKLELLKQEMEVKNNFKKLLYLQGRELEKIVDESLSFVGLRLNKPDVDNIEDRFFKDGKFSIPFEIRGKDSTGLNEKDLSQVIKRIADKEKCPKYKTRGVFVINHYRKKPLKERDKACSFNIVQQAKSFDICILTTHEIFKLVNMFLQGNKLDVTDKILNTAGLFSLDDLPNVNKTEI